MIWKGVMPAMTTAMNPDFSLDLSSIAKRAKWMIPDDRHRRAWLAWRIAHPDPL